MMKKSRTMVLLIALLVLLVSISGCGAKPLSTPQRPVHQYHKDTVTVKELPDHRVIYEDDTGNLFLLMWLVTQNNPGYPSLATWGNSPAIPAGAGWVPLSRSADGSYNTTSGDKNADIGEEELNQAQTEEVVQNIDENGNVATDGEVENEAVESAEQGAQGESGESGGADVDSGDGMDAGDNGGADMGGADAGGADIGGADVGADVGGAE